MFRVIVVKCKSDHRDTSGYQVQRKENLFGIWDMTGVVGFAERSFQQLQSARKKLPTLTDGRAILHHAWPSLLPLMAGEAQRIALR